MRQLVFWVVLALGTSATYAADPVRYFPAPPHSKNGRSDSFTEQWYSAQLKALGEPSLCCRDIAARHVYRFTWLRTFHRPVAIRLEENLAGKWTIHTKITSGAGGYDPGKLIVDESRAVSSGEIAPLAKLFGSGSSFWALPSADEDGGGLDGSRWIVEVRHGSRYHFVDRWTPSNGEVHDLGLVFMKLSKADFGKVY